uniref:Uncharacterized protein n=1 Tax=Romanomermis culicivorax TaxID=13658 RepID=A0A915HWB7_ROMCU
MQDIRLIRESQDGEKVYMNYICNLEQIYVRETFDCIKTLEETKEQETENAVKKKERSRRIDTEKDKEIKLKTKAKHSSLEIIGRIMISYMESSGYLPQ